MTKAADITKEQALALYNNNGAQLARALNIGRSFVSKWPKGKPIPELYALKLRYELKPEHFGKSA